MARKKSINEISNQLNRIVAREGYNSDRVGRAIQTANKYVDNIMASKSFNNTFVIGGNNESLMHKKFSRGVYMGLIDG